MSHCQAFASGTVDPLFAQHANAYCARQFFATLLFLESGVVNQENIATSSSLFVCHLVEKQSPFDTIWFQTRCAFWIKP